MDELKNALLTIINYLKQEYWHDECTEDTYDPECHSCETRLVIEYLEEILADLNEYRIN